MSRSNSGKMIRNARMKKGLTQTELAKMLAVSQGSVAAWEIGYVFPKAKTLVKLCDILEIRVEEILKAG